MTVVDPASTFLLAGAALFALALAGFGLVRDVLRKILALNMMASALFLLFAVVARRGPGEVPDPVPHAMVLTGIVVSFATSALALGLARRLADLTGEDRLPEERGDPMTRREGRSARTEGGGTDAGGGAAGCGSGPT